MSGWFLNSLAASGPAAEPVVSWDPVGVSPPPELPAVPVRAPRVALPPDRPELNPPEALGGGVKNRMGNVLWETRADREQAIGEELRPLCGDAEAVRRLVSHPWLVEQANATGIETSAITGSIWYQGSASSRCSPPRPTRPCGSLPAPWRGRRGGPSLRSVRGRASRYRRLERRSWKKEPGAVRRSERPPIARPARCLFRLRGWTAWAGQHLPHLRMTSSVFSTLTSGG